MCLTHKRPHGPLVTDSAGLHRPLRDVAKDRFEAQWRIGKPRLPVSLALPTERIRPVTGRLAAHSTHRRQCRRWKADAVNSEQTGSLERKLALLERKGGFLTTLKHANGQGAVGISPAQEFQGSERYCHAEPPPNRISFDGQTNPMLRANRRRSRSGFGASSQRSLIGNEAAQLGHCAICSFGGTQLGPVPVEIFGETRTDCGSVAPPLMYVHPCRISWPVFWHLVEADRGHNKITRQEAAVLQFCNAAARWGDHAWCTDPVAILEAVIVGSL